MPELHGCAARAGCGVVYSRGQGSTVVHGSRVGVGPELVVKHGCGARSGCGVTRAWGQGCMVVHAWVQDWF